MRLAANTYVFEMASSPVAETFKAINEFGFKHVDLAIHGNGDVTEMSEGQRKDYIEMFKGYGLASSQMIMVRTGDIASPDRAKRQAVHDYMKRCCEVQLELGGKQVLVCWGCGLLDLSVPWSESWHYSVESLRAITEWGADRGLQFGIELDPHVYFIVNNIEKMVRMIEDVEMPNLYPNIDIGHMTITREAPKTLEKVKSRILHVHISETESFDHTNSIIGTGCADFKAYVDKAIELGIEDNCARIGEVATAGIEMGESEGDVDDPKRWIQESLDYLKTIMPELTL